MDPGGQHTDRDSAADPGNEGGNHMQGCIGKSLKDVVSPLPSPHKALLGALCLVCFSLWVREKGLQFATLVKLKPSHRIIIRDRSYCCFPHSKKSHFKQFKFEPV